MQFTSGQHPAGSTRMRFLVVLFAPVVLLAGYASLGRAASPATRPAEKASPARSPEAEFQRRLVGLDSKDVKGHYQLAEWARDHRLYRRALKQAQYVLRLEPEHENARLLYRLVSDELQRESQNVTEPAAEEQGDTEFLSDVDIQKLRFAELLNDSADPIAPRESEGGRPAPRGTEEFVRVYFEDKVLRDFLDAMSGHPDFDTRDERASFLELSPTKQLQLIRLHTGTRFADRITILTDPLVFRRFKRVLPIVMAGCGTSGCHGGPEAHGYRLRTGRPRSAENLYTHFFILNQAHKGNLQLVDRANPEESLILQYGLPSSQAKLTHPKEIPAMFPRGREDVRYQIVRDWIEMLQMPEPRTGVTLPGYSEPRPPMLGSPTTAPATAPQ